MARPKIPRDLIERAHSFLASSSAPDMPPEMILIYVSAARAATTECARQLRDLELLLSAREAELARQAAPAKGSP